MYGGEVRIKVNRMQEIMCKRDVYNLGSSKEVWRVWQCAIHMFLFQSITKIWTPYKRQGFSVLSNTCMHHTTSEPLYHEMKLSFINTQNSNTAQPTKVYLMISYINLHHHFRNFNATKKMESKLVQIIHLASLGWRICVPETEIIIRKQTTYVFVIKTLNELFDHCNL
jgi:hypothetical protein